MTAKEIAQATYKVLDKSDRHKRAVALIDLATQAKPTAAEMLKSVEKWWEILMDKKVAKIVKKGNEKIYKKTT